MKRLLRTFILFLLIFLCGCSGGKISSAIQFDSEKLFQKELDEIYSQQYSVRRAQWLNALQNEDRNAGTLSSINELELMLENPDPDNSTKNKNLMQHFDRAALYMQILLFPAEREKVLQDRIKSELIFELSSIFLNISVAQNALIGLSKVPSSEPTLMNFWKNTISNQKIEYDTLRINEFNAAGKIPSLVYPLHIVPEFKNIGEYRKYNLTPARNAALAIYQQLSDRFNEKLPLVLLKLMYKTPYELNNLYVNNPQLKKDFSCLMTELVRLYRSEQLWTNMQNSFIIAQDFLNSVSKNKKTSPEMLDGCFKSQLTYELAYLKMLSQINISPFSPLPLPQDNIPQLAPARIETLQLILNDLLKKI